MHRLRLCRWIALVVGLLVAAARSAPLPFAIAQHDGSWRTVALERPLTDGLVIEALMIAPGSKRRFLVLRAPDVPAEPAALPAWAHRLKRNLAQGEFPVTTDEAATRIGFEGRRLVFDLAAEDGRLFHCELFAFAHEGDGWGVAYLAPREETPMPSPFDLLHPVARTSAGVVALAPFRVKEDPITTFQIGISIRLNPLTRNVSRIVVADVPPDSDAAAAGLERGDEVVAIDGKPSNEFSQPDGAPGETELGRIFLNRAPGDTVVLKVHRPGEKLTRDVRLRVPHMRGASPQIEEARRHRAPR